MIGGINMVLCTMPFFPCVMLGLFYRVHDLLEELITWLALHLVHFAIFPIILQLLYVLFSLLCLEYSLFDQDLTWL